MTRLRRTGILFLIASAATLALGFVVPVYVIWDRETGAQVVWSSDGEIIIQVGQRTDGWSGSIVAFLWDAILANSVGAPVETIKLAERVFVFSWNGAAFERQEMEDTPLNWYWVHNRTMYGTVGNALSRWTGKEFERIDRGEAQRVLAHGTSAWFTDIDGWSSLVNLLAIAPGAVTEHRISPGRQDVVIIASKSSDGRSKSLEVTVGNERRPLWALTERTQLVSGGTFRSAAR